MKLTDFINTIKGGQLGWSMVTVTIPKMMKTHNPYYGRVKKVTLTSNILFGMNYGKACTRKATTLAEGEKYNVEKPKGKTWEKYPYILNKDVNPDAKYLRVSYFPTRSSSKSIFFVDDHQATDEEMKIIRLFLQPIRLSRKQEEYGIEDGDQVIVRDYNFSNIAAIKQGDKEWDATGLSFDHLKSAIMKMSAGM